MMSFIKKNSVALAVGTLAIAAVTGAVYYFGKDKKKEENKKEDTKPAETTAEAKDSKKDAKTA